MTTSFDLLHRKVQQKLWDMAWRELRPIQEDAIRHLRTGGADCVISSATASGKTEAAFLPILSSIADDPYGSVRALYIGPLKALINDQFGRVEDLCARLELPVHRWHGDVDAGARKALLTRPAGVLLITPESLEAMFVLRATQIPRLFSRLSFVVIDELHAFLESERGAQLRSLLHRLERRAGCRPIRIGLSATLGKPNRALDWLRPRGPRAALIHDGGAGSTIAIRVRGVWNAVEPRDHDEDSAMSELARHILRACHGRTNLVFANAKAVIETLADELATQAEAMGLPDEIVVHHGSLSKTQREYAEERLRQTRPCTAVCSNTLEMGIDIGAIDDVVQVAAPWSVTSLVQRLGRSGRKSGARRVLRGYFVEDRPSDKSSLWDGLHLRFLQAVATIELMLEKCLEPPNTTRMHLSTLVHQLLSVLAETGGAQAAALFERLVASGSFSGIDRKAFALLLRELARHDLIEQLADRDLVLAPGGQKIVGHHSFYAAFNAPPELRVMHGGDEIGSVAQAPPPGEHLILAGRRWRVAEVDVERREVLVTPARGRRPPWFGSEGAAIHRIVHQKMRALATSDKKLPYLDDAANEILAAARQTAARCHGFRPPVQPYEGGVRLFVWKGSRIQQTLALVLRAAGLDHLDAGVGLDVKGDATAVRSVLRDFAKNPDPELLAHIADEQLGMRTLGREKFDPYLPVDLWRAAFIRDDLDVSGAVAVAAELAASFASPAPPKRSNASAGRTSGASLPATLEPLVSALATGTIVSDSPATVGRPLWGPDDLLRGLELRLAVPSCDEQPEVRLQQWAQQLDEAQRESDRFYSASFRIDPLGTSATLLAWRDELVAAGWDGNALAGGGDRLAALADVEARGGVLGGMADRLKAVERELQHARRAPFDALWLAEPEDLWPGRFRRVFRRLDALGAHVALHTPSFARAEGDSDLARIHALLSGDTVVGGLRGDGSVVIVEADTSWELAQAVAVLLRVYREQSAVVVRGADRAVLDHALGLHGLPHQGAASASPCRPAFQVLPLALEVSFEPRDPYRILELLTLTAGPFEGTVGRRLARALAQSPGVGGLAWREAKERAAASLRARLDEQAVAAQMERVEMWLEGPPLDPNGAPRADLLTVTDRVLAWFDEPQLAARAMAAGTSALLASARARARAFRELLAHDARPVLDLVGLRLLLGESPRGSRLSTIAEQAGRLEHVSSGASLGASRDVVIWWHAVVTGDARARARPWRRAELAAMADANIELASEPARLVAEAESHRRIVLAAKSRLVLAMPRLAAGDPRAPHPMWDEILARLGVQPGDAACALEARNVLRGELGPLHGPLPLDLTAEPAVSLPGGRPEWRIPTALGATTRQHTATSLDTLVGCPLRWLLHERARLVHTSIASIPTGPKLYGSLAHRLIEVLHHAGAFESAGDIGEAARARLPALLEQEGSVLLGPGMSFELAQLERQLLNAVRKLADLLHDSDLVIADVERSSAVAWRGGELFGRIDVLLRGANDREVILDMKWGRSHYRKLLEQGLAVQLAAYAAGHRIATGRSPIAAYFSLARGELLATEATSFRAAPVAGPRIDDTWRALERTVEHHETLLHAGRVMVAGIPPRLPLLERMGITSDAADEYLDPDPEASCATCAYGAICGRSWNVA